MPVLIRPESHTASHQGIPRLGQKTSEVTHRAALEMNKVSGINISLVQQVWRSHCLLLHQMWQFKLSNDRCFADNGAVALLRSGYALAARGHGVGKT